MTPVSRSLSPPHHSRFTRQGGKTLLVQGFELGSLNLASFLRSITGFNFNSIAILNLDLEAAILISPVTLPIVHLTGEKLDRFSITKGLSVQASMMFPPGCSSNSIGIVGAVNLSNPDITLAARLFLSTSGVVLEMTMSGCWENAFGANWLDICSIQSSVGMIPGVTLTSLALAGKVHIGDESCGTPLVATGFVGIDVITPANNYSVVSRLSAHSRVSAQVAVLPSRMESAHSRVSAQARSA